VHERGIDVATKAFACGVEPDLAPTSPNKNQEKRDRENDASEPAMAVATLG